MRWRAAPDAIGGRTGGDRERSCRGATGSRRPEPPGQQPGRQPSARKVVVAPASGSACSITPSEGSAFETDRRPFRIHQGLWRSANQPGAVSNRPRSRLLGAVWTSVSSGTAAFLPVSFLRRALPDAGTSAALRRRAQACHTRGCTEGGEKVSTGQTPRSVDISGTQACSGVRLRHHHRHPSRRPDCRWLNWHRR